MFCSSHELILMLQILYISILNTITTRNITATNADPVKLHPYGQILELAIKTK